MARRARTEPHAFLSYVREDSAEVDRLQRVLQAAGIPVWRDTESLWPGEDWRLKIQEAITQDSLVFIACFSRNSVMRSRSFQNQELLLAIDEFKYRQPDTPWLIPIRFTDCPLPQFDLGAGRTFDSLNRVDLFDGWWEAGSRRLINGIARIFQVREARRTDSIVPIITNPYDYEPIDSYPIFTWSGPQCLNHRLRKVERDDERFDRRVSNFFDLDEWRAQAAKQRLDGSVYTLTGFDYKDLDDDKAGVFTFAAASYREILATQDLFHVDRHARDEAIAILQRGGASQFVRLSPPNNVFINTSVVDASGRILALRRGAALHDTQRLWTLGPCETLRRGGDHTPSLDQPIDFEALAKKSLRKELGLEESQYGPVSVSWIGYSCWCPRPGDFWPDPGWPGMNVRIHAQVRAFLESHEIWGYSRSRAPDVFEHEKYAAIDWSVDSIVDIINSVIRCSGDSSDRRWLPFSGVAAQELYRTRALLDGSGSDS